MEDRPETVKICKTFEHSSHSRLTVKWRNTSRANSRQLTSFVAPALELSHFLFSRIIWQIRVSNTYTDISLSSPLFVIQSRRTDIGRSEALWEIKRTRAKREDFILILCDVLLDQQWLIFLGPAPSLLSHNHWFSQTHSEGPGPGAGQKAYRVWNPPVWESLEILQEKGGLDIYFLPGKHSLRTIFWELNWKSVSVMHQSESNTETISS